MGKNKDGKRAKGKDKKKNTFKKYGKNTTRGLRIKQADLEKKAKKRKNEGNHSSIATKQKYTQKGQVGEKRTTSMCKITCRDKKHEDNPKKKL